MKSILCAVIGVSLFLMFFGADTSRAASIESPKVTCSSDGVLFLKYGDRLLPLPWYWQFYVISDYQGPENPSSIVKTDDSAAQFTVLQFEELGDNKYIASISSSDVQFEYETAVVVWEDGRPGPVWWKSTSFALTDNYIFVMSYSPMEDPCYLISRARRSDLILREIDHHAEDDATGAGAVCDDYSLGYYRGKVGLYDVSALHDGLGGREHIRVSFRELISEVPLVFSSEPVECGTENMP